MSATSPDMMKWWKKLSENSGKILDLMSQVRATRNTDYYQSLSLCVKLLQWSADMAITYYDLSTNIDNTESDKEAMADRIDVLLKRRVILHKEYRRTFLATNRPKGIEDIDKNWNWTTERLVSLSSGLREDNFPIEYDKKTVLSIDFDGADKLKWQNVPDALVPTLKDGGPDGKGQYLSVPYGAQYCAEIDGSDLDFNDRPFLIEAWVRYQGQPQTGTIFGVMQYGTGHDGYALSLMNDGIIRLTVDESAFFNQYNLDCQKQHMPDDGHWHHIAINFYRNNFADFYLDGKYIETLRQKVTPKIPFKRQILIGSTFGKPQAPLGFDVDNIRIHQGFFTPEELQRLASL